MKVAKVIARRLKEFAKRFFPRFFLSPGQSPSQKRRQWGVQLRLDQLESIESPTTFGASAVGAAVGMSILNQAHASQDWTHQGPFNISSPSPASPVISAPPHDGGNGPMNLDVSVGAATHAAASDSGSPSDAGQLVASLAGADFGGGFNVGAFSGGQAGGSAGSGGGAGSSGSAAGASLGGDGGGGGGGSSPTGSHGGGTESSPSSGIHVNNDAQTIANLGGAISGAVATAVSNAGGNIAAGSTTSTSNSSTLVGSSTFLPPTAAASSEPPASQTPASTASNSGNQTTASGPETLALVASNEPMTLSAHSSGPLYPLPAADPIGTATGLLDGNSTVDAVFLGSNGTLTVARNAGSGRWSDVSTYNLGVSQANGMALGLFGSADVFPDIAIQTPDSILILSNTGSASFALAQTIPASVPGEFALPGGGRVGMVTTLLDGRDFYTDLATVTGSGEVLVFHGSAHGTLGAPDRYTTGASAPVAVVAGNFIGDGSIDLAVAHASGAITFLRGQSSGAFALQPGATINGLGVITDVTATDLDNDTDTDLAISATSGAFALFNNDDPLTVNPIVNGGFDAGLTGWVATGNVNGLGGMAQLHEGTSSFLSSIAQTFLTPGGASVLSLDLVSFLESPDGRLPDAVEVSLLRADNTSLVPTLGNTSFFNINKGVVSTAPGVTFDGTRLTVDISALPAGTSATLIVDLIGLPQGNSSVVSVDNVTLTPSAIYDDTFTVTALPGTFADASGIAAGDVDADGNPDLAAVDAGLNALLTFVGDGTGAFTRTDTDLSVYGLIARAVALGQLTPGDTADDPVIAMQGSDIGLSPLIYDADSPTATVVSPSSGQLLNVGVGQIQVQFSEDVLDTGTSGEHSVTNPASYALTNLDTNDEIPIGSVSYDAGTFLATLTIAASVAPIFDGHYQVRVKATIQDLAGNALNGGTDTTSDFSIDATPPSVILLQPSPSTTGAVNEVHVRFSEAMFDGGASADHSVSNPAGYVLTNTTTSQQIPITSVTFVPGTLGAVLTIDSNFAPLAYGSYQLIVNGQDTQFGLQDVAGNRLHGGLDTTLSFQVANEAPVVTSVSNISGSEGQTVTLNASFNDTNHHDSHTALISWADGSTSVGTVSEANGVGTVTGTHVYADNNAAYQITVTVSDGNLSGSGTATAAIANVAPTVTPASNQVAAQNQSLSLTAATFTDPGFSSAVAGTQETFGTSTINWGDGSPTESGTITVTQGSPGVLTTGSLSGSHVFSSAGTFTVTVTIRDDDGGATSATFTVQVTGATAQTKFFVVDQSAHATFGYDAGGSFRSETDLANSRPRGIASNTAGDTHYVIDANKRVYVYSAAGVLLGSWSAGGLNQPQDITTDGTDIWIVDNASDKVFRYANAASRLSGSQNPSQSFALASSNRNSSGLVTDGQKLWVTDDFNHNNRVVVYNMTGVVLGAWTLDATNDDPSGITLNPNGGTDLWVVDRHDSMVYRYANAMTFLSGNMTATDSFALASGNHHPEGIADPTVAIAIGQVVNGSLGAAGQVDAYSFTGAAGQSLFFDVQDNTASSINFSLLQPDGGPLLQAYSQDRDVFTLPTSGTYTVIVSGQGNATGAYQFQVWDVPATTTTSISVGQTVTGTISAPGQQVNYTLAGTSGQHLFFDVLGSAGSALSFAVYRADTSLLLRADNDNQGNTFTLPADETYTVVVDDNGAIDATGSYDFTVVSIPTDTPQAIGYSAPISGAITSPGQTASYTFHGNAGQSILVDVTANAGGDINFTLLDPSGGAVFSNASDDSTVNALPATGTYTLVAAGSGDNVGSFGFKVTDQSAITTTGQTPMTTGDATTTTQLSGRNVGPIDLDHLHDITGVGQAVFSGTTFNRQSQTLFASMQVTNTGPVDLAAPIVTRFDSFTPISHLTTADGFDANDKPFWAFTATELGAASRLAPNATSAAIGLEFAAPIRDRFTFEVTVLAPDNTAPVFTSTPSDFVFAGSSYIYQPTATDADGDSLTFALLVAPAGMTVAPTNGHLSWTPGASQLGANSVTLQVSDARGGRVMQHFDVQVLSTTPVSGNYAPRIITEPVTTAVLAGQTFTYTVQAVDADNDPLMYSLAGAPQGMTINSATGRITWVTAASDAGGSFVVSILVQDGHGGSDTQTFTLLEAIKQTPSIRGTLYNDLDQSGTFTAGDQGLSGWVVYLDQNQNGVRDPGESFTTTDANGGYVFTNVAPGRHLVAEEVQAGYVSTAPVGGAGFVNIAATVNNAPANLVSFWTGNGTAADSADGNNGTLQNGATFGPGFVGQAFSLDNNDDQIDVGNAANLQVSAGQFTIDAWVKFNATGGDRIIFNKMSPIGANSDGWMLLKQASDRFWFSFGGTGGQNGATPTAPTTVISTTTVTAGVWYHVAAVKSATEIAVYVNGVKETSKPVPAFNDTNSTTLRLGRGVNGFLDEADVFNRALTDAEILSIYNMGSVGKSVAVVATFNIGNQVAGANNAPTFSTTAPVSGQANSPYYYDANVTDADGDAVHFELLAHPQGMVVDPSTGELFWTPSVTQVGSFFVSLSAVDARGASTLQDFHIQVSPAATNHAPYIVSTPTTARVLAGQTFSYTVQALDPDGDSLTYSLVLFAEGMTIDSATGRISWTPDASEVGSDTITVKVDDGHGGSDLQSFVLTVSATAAMLQGTVFNDLNADGMQGAGELGLSGWTVYLDENQNNVPDAGERNTVSDSSGRFVFTNLVPGSYLVAEVPPAGWVPTSPVGGVGHVTIQTDPANPAPSQMGAWWTGDGTADDIVGPNDGGLINGATYAPGVVGQAFSFNGSNYVEVGNSADVSMNSSTSSTIEFWAYRTGTSDMHILGKRAGNDINYQFVWEVNKGINGSAPGGDNLPLNTWTHVVQSFDVANSNLFRLYVNGQIVAQGNGNYGPQNNATLRIGTSGGFAGFIGRIDEVAFYHRVVTTDEVLSHYQAGLAGAKFTQVGVQNFGNQVAGVNHDPSFTTTAPTAATTGHLFSYDAAATDSDGDILRFELLTHPQGMVVVPSNGEVLWTPDADQVGQHLVELRVFDGRGGSAVESFTINVAAGASNHAPIITSQPLSGAVAGTTYRYTAQATDPDGDAVTYLLTAAPDGMLINQSTGEITWDTHGAYSGTYSVSIFVEDGRGGTATQSFSFTVTTSYAAFEGRAFNDLDDSGDFTAGDTPLAGIAVFIDQNQNGVRDPGEQFSTTDNAGRYTFYNLTPGAYVVAQETATGFKAVSSIQVTPENNDCVPPPQGMDSWWTGDNTGDLDNDLLGNNNGTLVGVTYAPGKVDQAFQFNGSNYLSIPNSSDVSLAPGEPMTLDLWAMRTSTPGNPNDQYHLLGKRAGAPFDSSQINYQMYWTAGNSTQFVPGIGFGGSSGGPGAAGSNYLPLNTWQHIAVTFDGTTVKMFVDGELKDSRPMSSFGPVNNADLRIGKSGDVAGFPGLIDEVEWFHRALSEDEIRAVYNAGAAGKCKPGHAHFFDLANYAVVGANNNPSFTSTAPTQVTYGSAFHYLPTATDPDGDPLQYTLASGPAGMIVGLGTGEVLWTPTFDQVSPQSVTLRVTDNRGGLGLQTYTVSVDVPDAALTITSTPPLLATQDTPYSYFVTTSGTATSFSLPTAPTGMSVDNSGHVTWTPADTDVGFNVVSIQAVDASGNVAVQTYLLDVRATNVAPAIISTPIIVTAAGALYRYRVRATDTDSVSYSVTGPAGMSIDPVTGLISWQAAGIDDYPIVVRATDERGAFSEQPYTLTVTDDTEAPLVGVGGDLTVLTRIGANEYILGSAGQPVPLNVSAVDNVGVVSETLTINNVPYSLDANGNTTFTPPAGGIYTLVAQAADARGNVGTRTATIQVLNGNEADYPVVDITSPLYGDTVTYLTQVTGTVTDQNLAYYQLQYAPVDSEDWVTFATGTTPVVNGTLGTFDPTLLLNNEYRIRVTAVDLNGLTTYKEIHVGVSQEAKLGNFRLEFNDLTIPVTGVPITITRVYDTLRAKESGDFGFGWSLSFLEGNIREGVPVHPQESANDALIVNAFRMGTRVYINNPDGRRVGFTFLPEAQSTLLGTVFYPKFVADPGVYETLTVDNVPLSQRADGTFGLYLFKFPWNPQNYTLTTKDGLAYRYNQFSELQTITDRNGNVLTVTSGGIESSDGTSIDFVRDAVGRITEIVDPAGNSIHYGYSPAGDLISMTNQIEKTSTYEYLSAPAHYLSKWTNPLGDAVVRTEYGEDGRLKATKDALGNESKQSFDLANNQAVVGDALGHETVLTFDDRGNVVHKLDAELGETSFVVDANNNVVSMTDPRTNTWSRTFDSRGNKLSETDPLLHTESWTYTDLNKVATYTDKNGSLTENAHDSRGNLLQTKVAGSVTVTNTWDSAGRMISTKDGENNTTMFVYGTNGSQPTQVMNHDGTHRDFTFDFWGQVLTASNENGELAQIIYDNTGRPQLIRDAENLDTVLGWDDANRLVSITDPNGNETRHIRDAAGRTIKEIDPLLAFTTFVFDAAGNLLETTNRNGRVRQFEYDRLNRQTAEKWMDGATVVRTISWTLDANGNIITANDPDSTYSFTFDEVNRLTSVDNAGTPGAPHVVLAYTLDAVGNVLAVVDNAGVRVDSTYDERNRLETRLWSGGGIDVARVNFQYNGSDQITQIDRFSDLAGTQLMVSNTNVYDDRRRMVSQTYTDGSGGVLVDYGYQYDDANRLVQQTDHGQTSVYGYDRTNQLLSALHTGQPNEQFSWDANGNPNGPGYVIGTGNRVLSDGTFNNEWDGEGNLVKKTEISTGDYTEYTWDFGNRLVGVTEKSSGGVILHDVQYAYDMFGRRITETVDGTVTRHVYNGVHVWADFDGTGAVKARYLFGDKIDQILARFRPGEGTAWYLADKLGTIRDLANAVGAIINHVQLTSFGLPLFQSNPAAADRFLLAGREFNATTGLYSNLFRWLSPSLMRFISDDPLGFLAGDFNLSRYVQNSPTNYADPFGLAAGVEDTGTRAATPGHYKAIEYAEKAKRLKEDLDRVEAYIKGIRQAADSSAVRATVNAYIRAMMTYEQELAEAMTFVRTIAGLV